MAKRAPKFKNSINTKPSIGEAFNDFTTEKAGLGRSKATIRNYEQSFDLFTSYHNINVKEFLLEDLTEQQFYQWRQHMIENEIRPQSINHYIRDLRTFLNWCKEKQLVDEVITLKEMKHQEDLPKMYSDEEMDLLLSKPQQGDSYTRWRDWAIINLIFATGLRAATVCALTIDCLNFEREQIAIPQQKNKRAAFLPMVPSLAVVLKEYLKKWMKDEPEDAFLFQSFQGGELTVNALHTSVNKLCARYGFKGHGVHSIRHNFARDMIVNGGKTFQLQAFLQHSNIQMSQHYVKLFSKDLSVGLEEYNPLEVRKKKTSKAGKFKKG